VNATEGQAPSLDSVSNGRAIKFTRERFEQIRNLVERGMSPNQIAEMIGTTVGSLAVSCSRVGISLRRPKASQPSKPKLLPPPSTNGTKSPPPVLPSMTISLTLDYRGCSRTSVLALDPATIVGLILRANLQDVPLIEFVTDLLQREQDQK
jgi:hypothetical protein